MTLFYYLGNATLVLLFLDSVIVLGVGIERLFFYFQYKRFFSYVRRLLENDLKESDLQRLSLEGVGGSRMMDDLLRFAFRKEKRDDYNEILRSKIDCFVEESALLLSRNLAVLSSCVTISPILGILGTVFGMIYAFSGFTENKENFVVGISQALYTTAIGLVIAVLALLFYNYFNRKLEIYCQRFFFLLRKEVYERED